MNNELQNGEQLEKPMGLGEWLITMIVLAIPCVGLIMTAIGIVLSIILYATMFAALSASMGRLS